MNSITLELKLAEDARSLHAALSPRLGASRVRFGKDAWELKLVHLRDFSLTSVLDIIAEECERLGIGR